MRKAGVNILVVIIIGLVVLIVIASGIIPQIPKFFSKNILPIFGIVPKQVNETVSVVEKEDTEQKIPVLVLDSDPKTAAHQLALAAFDCWIYVKNTEEDKHICCEVNVSRLKGSFNKSDVFDFLLSFTPKSESKKAFDALNDNSAWLIEDDIFDFTPRFYVCADYDTLNQNDLVFSHNIFLCNPKAKAKAYVPYVLPSNRKEASDLIVRALANCWSSVQNSDFIGPCAFFDPKNLKGKISKKFVVRDFKNFNEFDVPELEYGAKRLESLWSPDDDAFMELSITNSSKPFFVCGSDWWGLVKDKLCLTHNINNDCCDSNTMRSRGT